MEMSDLLVCSVVNAADARRRPPVHPEDVSSSAPTRLDAARQEIRR